MPRRVPYDRLNQRGCRHETKKISILNHALRGCSPPRAFAAPTPSPLALPSDPRGPPHPHPGNSFIIIEAYRKIDRHSPMLIIISSDTTARSRCTSHRDGRVSSPRLLVDTHARGRAAHLHTVTRARIRANPHARPRARPCARKEESDRFDLGGFFFFFPTWTDISPPLSPGTPLFSNRAPGSSICVPRTPPRIRHAFAAAEDRSGSLVRSSPIRSRQGSPFRPVSSRQFP